MSRKSRDRERPPKPRNEDPIRTAIKLWLPTLPYYSQASDAHNHDALLTHAPKRFTIYDPMVLLPSGSFNTSPWLTLFDRYPLDESLTDRLWASILAEISKTRSAPLTHLAVSDGIPPHQLDEDGLEEATASATEMGPHTTDGTTANLLRSPSGGLRTLYGDFGPSRASRRSPSQVDFDNAFWVSTKQNGIHQIWAPRWTMFSRGNVKEKARVLTFSKCEFGDSQATESTRGPRVPWAVDLYAGIGYFAFSYAKMGFRVLCWELNPWSVEALRRGAVANGWKVRIVQGDNLLLPSAEIGKGCENLIVFLEDNQSALQRIRDMRAESLVVDVSHINGGLLPTSQPSWPSAWSIAQGQETSCWLHLHENLGTGNVDRRRDEVQRMFDKWAEEDTDRQARKKRVPRVDHVEKVKTYAPGVWHCVFDIHIT